MTVLSSHQFRPTPRTGQVVDKHATAMVNQYRPDHYYLYNLNVSPKHRGQGIGTEFMHNLLAEHDAAGSKVSLHTARPELKKWYGGMGFEETGHDVIGTRMTRQPRG